MIYLLTAIGLSPDGSTHLHTNNTIQHAMRMRHIVICGLPLSTIFYHIISKMARFSGGGGEKLLNTKCVF